MSDFNKVDYLIVGFQKCGTSALHNFLSNHPKIISSNPKEAHFFSYDYRYNKGIDYYHSFFKKINFPNNKNIKYLEASPSYVNIKCYKKSLQRIKAYNSEIKVICLVRNPIHRAYSAWVMFKKFFDKNPSWYIDNQVLLYGYRPELIRRTSREINDFNVFIEKELEYYNKNTELEAPILYKGLFFEGIDYYSKNLGENFLLIKNEEFKKNTPDYLSKITEYLNLDRHDWSQFENKKFFSNEYKLEINKETKDKLLKFYFDDMVKLNDNYGINYLE